MRNQIHLDKYNNNYCVERPSDGQETGQHTPELLTCVVCTSPDRNKSPGCVGSKAKHEDLAKRDILEKKCKNVYCNHNATGGDAVQPENLPEQFLPSPRAKLGRKKPSGEMSIARFGDEVIVGVPLKHARHHLQ